MAENPKLADVFPLPEEAKKLQFFVGDWNVAGTMTFEGKTFRVGGYWKFTSIAAGWGVMNIGKMEIERLGAYEEVDILGFDPNEKLFHMFSVTNTAAAHDHKAKWSDATVSFVYEGLQDGKRYREEILVKILGPSEMRVHEEDSLDGSIVSTMDVTLKKSQL